MESPDRETSVTLSSIFCHAASWNPFLDPESDIFSYTWCIGTSVGSCDVLPHTDPHTALGLVSADTWTYTGVFSDQYLPDGAYYVTVRATNGIAYGGPLFTTVQHTTPYKVDTTPPFVSEDARVSYNASTNQLTVEYEASDVGGGQLEGVELALGGSPLDTSALDWQPLVNQSASRMGMGQGAGLAVVEVEIPDGVPVWLKLRATDRGRTSL